MIISKKIKINSVEKCSSHLDYSGDASMNLGLQMAQLKFRF